jgi:3-deoxy-7-phosphoheptulonate synthase
MSDWTPSSWRALAAAQQPHYADAAAASAVEARLAAACPVVAIAECAALRAALADDDRFILQGGDCAESFDDAVAERVAALTDLFESMIDRLTPALARPPLAVARMAGQFAKPRSRADEQVGDQVLPAYRGDIINGFAFDPVARAPDPQRMARAHLQSVGTAASLAAARHAKEPIYTSHEALLLPYEQALARRDDGGRWWATSGHMLWLGDRTREPDGGHVEFLSGVANAIGVKCGPTMTGEALIRLCARLDPDNQPGRLLLIGRFGAGRVEALLPPLLRASRSEGLAARWAIDPMHGNTTTAGGRKIRRLPDILAELDAFFAIARAEAVQPGGVHLEMSALDVTECLGGRGPASLAELDLNWQSACDPRLNRAQALDLADHLAALLAPAVAERRA